VSTTSNKSAPIQGLRAIAVLSVVLFHAGKIIPGGFIGVDIFFVISGYVITRMLVKQYQENQRISLRKFYFRRLKRLGPALSILVIATTVAAAYILSPFGAQQLTTSTALSVLTLTSNFVIANLTGDYFDSPSKANPLLNMWSLSIEEQFYLVFPALLIFALTVSKKIKFKPYSIIFFSILLALSFWTVTLDLEGNWFGFYGPLSRAWEFLVGCFLYLVIRNNAPKKRIINSALVVIGLGLLIYSFIVISESTIWPSVWTLIPVFGTCFLILGTSQNTGIGAKVVGIKPLALIGDWSYSIYLWHWPFIVFAQIIFPENLAAPYWAAAGSLIPAIGSYYLIEQPIRESHRRSKKFIFAVVFLSFILPVSTVKTLEYVQTNNLGPYQKFAHQQDVLAQSHFVPAEICSSRGPWPEGSLDGCWIGKYSTGQPIYLVGDSNANQFTESIIGAAKNLNSPAWISVTTSCPFIEDINLEFEYVSQYFLETVGSSEFYHCKDYVASVEKYLSTSRPGLVVISSLDQYWWDAAISASIGNLPLTNNPNAKAQSYRDGLVATINSLKSMGHSVLLVQSIPTFRNPLPIWDPTLCTYFQIVSQNCKGETDLVLIDQMQQMSRQAVSQSAALTDSKILDLRKYFCSAKVCSTSKEGKWLYKDAAHLSTEAATDLIPEFTQAIKSPN
jgi:peptidoglycan/LPS O-acetylase OafA/YrhL